MVKDTRLVPLNPHRVKAFRHEVYGCFRRARDALFNTVDALLTEDRAKSFPELSLSPFFERQWPSLYEAFEDGNIDQQRLREVFARFLPRPTEGKDRWIGIDVSGIARPRSGTAADRSAKSRAYCAQVRQAGHLRMAVLDGRDLARDTE